jgi:hypothetical protein
VSPRRAGSRPGRRGSAMSRIQRQRLAQRARRRRRPARRRARGRASRNARSAPADRPGEPDTTWAVGTLPPGCREPQARGGFWFASTSTWASDPPVALGDGGLQSRPELAARPAPLGPEVDHDRQLAGALHDLGDEVSFVDVCDHGAVEVSERAESTRWLIGTQTPRCAASC